MTERLYIDPRSSHFGEVVTIVEGTHRGDGQYVYMGKDLELVNKRWLKDLDYPMTHPETWSRLVDQGTRDRLIDSSFETCDSVARSSTEEAFGDCDLSTRNSARLTIYRMLKQPVEEEDRDLMKDIRLVIKVLDND